MDRPRSRPAVVAGVGGGLVGATCCIGPAVGIASGAGAGSFLLAMGRYRPLLFVIGGLVSLAIAAVLVHRRRATCATGLEYRRLRGNWLTTALVAFALTYGLGRLVVAPLIERL
ncbi:MAG: hypothetical protein ACRDJP_09940 [Actinomycetota bacterium]